MHSLPVFDLNGKEKGRISLPRAFSEKVRNDLIQRAVLSEVSKLRQAYGSDPLAGQRSSAHYHGRRSRRDTQMNREISRMKRIHGQGFLNLTARVVPQAVKGRRAHPPKSGKKWALKINKKERIKALKSALSATLDRNLVSGRGHRVSKAKHVPLVLEDGFQKISKTIEAVKILKKFGLEEELERCGEKKVRSGKGKMRGRKYRTKRGPLVVIEKDEGVRKALENIPGIDISLAKELDVGLLAPGTHPGRFTVFTKSAIKELDLDGREKGK
ncbi:MAG: 50S ribosomal protein L4 [Candidatus Aenigmarchaeota archaeon]